MQSIFKNRQNTKREAVAAEGIADFYVIKN
jgi:hypothetical protein